MNTLLGESKMGSGKSRILCQNWAIDTLAGNAGSFGLVVAKNPDRKRVVIQAVDLVFGAWVAGDKVVMAAAPETDSLKSAVILFMGNTPAQQMALVYPSWTGELDAAEGLGTITVPSFVVPAYPVTGDTIAGLGQFRFDLSVYTGEIYLVSQDDGGGSPVKYCSIIEESGP